MIVPATVAMRSGEVVNEVIPSIARLNRDRKVHLLLPATLSCRSKRISFWCNSANSFRKQEPYCIITPILIQDGAFPVYRWADRMQIDDSYDAEESNRGDGFRYGRIISHGNYGTERAFLCLAPIRGLAEGFRAVSGYNWRCMMDCCRESSNWWIVGCC